MKIRRNFMLKCFVLYLFCVVVACSACSASEDISSSEQTKDTSIQKHDADEEDDSEENQAYEYGEEQTDLVYRPYRMGTFMRTGDVVSLSAADIEADVEGPEEFAFFFNDKLSLCCKYEPEDGKIEMPIGKAGYYCFFVRGSDGKWTDVTAYATVWKNSKEGADLL